MLLFIHLLANETPNASVNVNGFHRLTGGGESESDIVPLKKPDLLKKDQEILRYLISFRDKNQL